METYWQDKLKNTVQQDPSPDKEGGDKKSSLSPLAFFRNLIASQTSQRKSTPTRTTRPSEPRRSEYNYDRDTVVPLLYGKKPIDGIPIPIAKSGNYLYVIYIFCEGEIDSYVSYEIDGQAVSNFSGLYSFTEYTGTTSQTYNATLHGLNSDFTDPLTSTAYVVARWTASEKFNSVPRLRAVIKGKKVYDHRTGLTAYSTNPILCDVDRQMSKRYGCGTASATFDWTTIDTAADDCEVIVNSENRYDLNYLITNPSGQEHVSDFILAHCNGERIFSQGKWYYYVHKERSSVATFTQDEVWGVTLSRPQQRDVFNRVKCSYVQPDDWREDEYSLETSELIAGSEPESTGNFDFTGCSSLSQVHRLATFQLNARVSDLFLTFYTYNTKGVERFDRFQFTHDVFSLNAQDFYVLSVDDNKITATEYSADLFTDTLVSNPTLPEANLPLPTDVPDDVTGLTVTESTQEAQDGHTTTLLDISWTASVFPWVKHYEIWTYKTGGSYQFYDTTTDTSATIQTTSELTTHYVKIVTISKLDIPSVGAEYNVTLSTTVASLPRVFVTTPTVPYKVGDLWDRGTSLGIWRCNTAQASGGSYSVSHWQSAADVTPPFPSDEKLEGYWPLDDGSGTTVADLSGNGNNGTTSGSPTWDTAAVAGGCLSFNGTNYFYIPDDTTLNFGTDDFTITAWFNVSATGNYSNLICKGAGAGLSGWRFGLYASGYPCMLIGDTAGYTNGSFGSINYADSNWHFLAISFDRSSNATCYVDGESIGTHDISARAGSVDSTDNLIVAYSYDHYPGKLDEIRMYRQVLTAKEIKALYNFPSGNRVSVTNADQIAESATNKWAGESGADVTSANNQSISWIDESVGTSLPVANTDAKCTDATADHTNSHTANDTDHVNGAQTDSGYTYDVLGDLRIMNGKDIEFYTGDGSGFSGGVYGDSGGVHLSSEGTARISGSGVIISAGDGTVHISSSDGNTTIGGNVSIGSSSDIFKLHVQNGVEDPVGSGIYVYDAWTT